MLKTLILGALLLINTPFSYAHPFSSPEAWSNPQIASILKHSRVIEVKSMRESLIERGKKADFDGQVFLVTLEGGIKAVFKSIPLDDQGDAAAEVAAYRASLYLGFPYVPPTVIREINGMKGSLQLFVDTKIDLLTDGEYKKALTKASDAENANLRIFYFVLGQWDSGPHNMLAYDSDGELHLIAIDNAGIRNRQYVHYGELPFVRVVYSDKLNTDDYDKPFPFKAARIIQKASLDNLKKTFQNKLPDSFYSSFNSYNQPLKYIIYQNALWRQYHAFDEGFIKAYADKCPSKTLEALRKLDLQSLRDIFSEAKGLDFLTPIYLKSILERRDEVIDKCQLER